MSELTPEARLDLLRARAAREVHWLAPALWALRGPYLTERLPHPAAVSSDGRLYVNPAHVQSASDDTVVALLEHEVWHLVLSHSARAEAESVTDAEARTWNWAADVEIHEGHVRPNGLQALLAQWPGSCTAEMLRLPRGLLAEEYYRLLQERAARCPGGGGGSGDGDGDAVPGGSAADGQRRDYEIDADADGEADSDGDGATPGIGPVEMEALRRAVAQGVIEAMREERLPGDMPGGMQRWASEIVAPPQVPWRTVLRRAVQGSIIAAGKIDYSYSRPSRRDAGAARGYVSPGMVGYRPRVAAVVDTSGSMQRSDLDACMAEVVGIVRALGGEIVAAACDVAATKFKRVRQARDLDLTGGGGTDMGVGIEAAEALRPKVNVIVVLTDGYTPWPKRATRAKLLVVSTRTIDSAPPWAQVVKIEVGP